jgi:hypothetical protein
MDWIGEIEKHAGALGRPPMFDEAMTTLAFRIENSMKDEVKFLAEYLTKRRKSKSSAGAVARTFISSGLREMREPFPEHWISEIVKHSRGKSEEVLTTLSFRLERSLKKDVDVVARRLSRHFTGSFKSSSSIGAIARAFIAAGLEQTQAQYPEFKTFLIERLQEGRRSQTKRPPMPRANDEKLQKSKATDNVKKRPPGGHRGRQGGSV